jgi:hypothetical protein
VYLLVIINIET